MSYAEAILAKLVRGSEFLDLTRFGTLDMGTAPVQLTEEEAGWWDEFVSRTDADTVRP